MGRGGRFSRDPLPLFSVGGHCEHFWREQWYPLFDVVHPAFGIDLAVEARDIPEAWEFPSLDGCQKRFLRTHKGVDLAPHPVVGLVLLQAGDAEQFTQAFGLERLEPFRAEDGA